MQPLACFADSHDSHLQQESAKTDVPEELKGRIQAAETSYSKWSSLPVTSALGDLQMLPLTKPFRTAADTSGYTVNVFTNFAQPPNLRNSALFYKDYSSRDINLNLNPCMAGVDDTPEAKLLGQERSTPPLSKAWNDYELNLSRYLREKWSSTNCYLKGFASFHVIVNRSGRILSVQQYSYSGDKQLQDYGTKFVWWLDGSPVLRLPINSRVPVVHMRISIGG